MKIFSDKAFEIAKTLDIDGMNGVIKRGDDGEVILAGQPPRICRIILSIIGCGTSVKKLANSTRTFTTLSGKTLKHSDLALLQWLIVSGLPAEAGFARHSLATLRKHFGDFAVDEMLGQRTANPIKYYRGKTIQAELDKSDVDFEAKRAQLVAKRDARINAIKAEHMPKISELNAQIRKLNDEIERIRFAMGRELDEATRECRRGIDAAKAERDELRDGLKKQMNGQK